MTNQTDLIEQRDSFKAAALREHDQMRHWMQRALTAESRLNMYDQREKQS